MNFKNEPIIIIGMHRSGTTMVSKMIEELGVFLGARKFANNEATFFQKLNSWALLQHDCTVVNVKSFDDKSKELNSFISEAMRYKLSDTHFIEYLGLSNFLKYKLKKEMPTVWGWKDPKSSITLPIWKMLFPNAKIINIIRNPIDVAQSLKTREDRIISKLNQYRNSFFKEYIFGKDSYSHYVHSLSELENGFKMWCEYVEAINKTKSSFNQVLDLRYEDFLLQPEKYLNNIAKFLEIEISKEKIESLCENVNSERRYSFTKNKELVEFYKNNKDNRLLVEMDYHKILE